MRSLLIFLFILIGGSAYAEETALEPAACYKAFKQYSPADVIAFAKQARDYIQKNEASIKDFNKVSPLTFRSFPFSPAITVMRCDEMKVVSFVFPEMLRVVSEPGYLIKFIDVNGQHTFVSLCAKMRGNAEAAWTMQEHFWMQCNGALKMGVLMLKVPGTPYVIQSSLPSDTLTLKDFEASLK